VIGIYFSYPKQPGGNMTEPRLISTIAADIKSNWANVNYAAKPYLDAMSTIDYIDDSYYCEEARDIVTRFLSNARAFRGPEAKRIKAELKSL
jgi:hypothetical protein